MSEQRSLPVLLTVTLLLALGADLYIVDLAPQFEAIINVLVVLACGATVVACRHAHGPIDLRWILHAHWPILIALSLQAILFFVLYYDGKQVLPFTGYLASPMLSFVLLSFYYMRDSHLRLWTLKAIVWITVMLCLPSFVGSMGHEQLFGLPLSNKERNQFFGLIASGGVLSHPLTMGTQCVVGGLSAWFLFKVTGGLRWIVLLVPIGAALVCSNARASMAIAVSAASLLVLARLSWRMRVGTVACVCIGAGTLVGKHLDVESRFPRLSQMLRIEEGDSRRMAMWEVALPAILKKPLVGHGFKAAQKFTLDLESEYEFAYVRGTGFHDVHIDNAFNFGIAFCLLYVLAYVKPFWRTLFNLMPSTGRLFCVVGGLVCLLAPLAVPYSIGGVRLTSVCLTLILGMIYGIVYDERGGVEDWLETSGGIGGDAVQAGLDHGISSERNESGWSG